MKGTLTSSGRAICLVLIEFDASSLLMRSIRNDMVGDDSVGHDVWIIRAIVKKIYLLKFSHRNRLNLSRFMSPLT